MRGGSVPVRSRSAARRALALTRASSVAGRARRLARHRPASPLHRARPHLSAEVGAERHSDLAATPPAAGRRRACVPLAATPPATSRPRA